jgi:hypothetical protein
MTETLSEFEIEALDEFEYEIAKIEISLRNILLREKYNLSPLGLSRERIRHDLETAYVSIKNVQVTMKLGNPTEPDRGQ